MCSISKIEMSYETDFKKNVKYEEKVGHTYMQWIYALLVSTTLLTYGMQAGWLSPMTKVLQSDQSPTGKALTDAELSWMGSTLGFSATLGVIIYSLVVDACGRRFAVIAILVPQAICWIIKLFATNATMLIIARMFGGFPSGGCFIVIPMYVKEISQDNIRGAVVSSTLLMQNLGVLAIYAMGAYLDYYVVLYIVIPIPVVACVLMIFVPESPAFLVEKQKFQEAVKITALLRGLDVNDKSFQVEVENMRNEEMKNSSLPKLTILNIFKNRARLRGFVYIMLVITAQAFNGSFAITTYGLYVLASSSASFNPELLSLVVPILMIFGSLVSMACVEKMGRKKLLMITYVLTVVVMLYLGITQYLQSIGYHTPSWLTVIAIGTVVWAYSAGITPMIYVVMAELFSFQVRAKLIGCIVTYGWFTSSIQLAVFSPITNAFGIHTMFFIFAVTNLFGAAVTTLLPETRGKSVEEIERTLIRKK